MGFPRGDSLLGVSLVSALSEVVGAAFVAEGLDAQLGAVVPSQRPELSQFQCNGALAGAKTAGRAPRDLAESLAERLSADARFGQIDIAGPGFLNLSVTDEYLAEALTAHDASDTLGVDAPAEPRTIVLDYGGPNVAKDLHIGHIRPALIGESLKRMHTAGGYSVVADIHLGDWGLPMGQLIAILELEQPDLPYFDASNDTFPAESPVTIEDLQILYPRASAMSKEDDEFAARAQRATVLLQQGEPGHLALWNHFRDVSVEALKSTYDRLGATWDLWDGEATVADAAAELVNELKASGTAVDSDGAVVIPVATDDDTKEVPPLMLTNSRGGLTYAATDLATIQRRVDDLGATDMVYIVDQRQALHFEQVFRGALIAGVAPASAVMEHAGNGTVNGPDGKPFKTRDGGTPRLHHVIDEVVELAAKRLDESELAAEYDEAERTEIATAVGLAALKFGELSNHRTTNYSFDLERFTQLTGKTGPYIQYVAARCGSILRRLQAESLEPGEFAPAVDPAERTLALKLLEWPEVLDRALTGLSPSTIAEWAFETASAFNQFYDACHILPQEDPKIQGSWLALVQLTRRALVHALDLLTIEVPERM